MPELWEWLCHLPQEAQALLLITPTAILFLPELFWPTKLRQVQYIQEIGDYQRKPLPPGREEPRIEGY